jgi:hypothetical protein
MLVNVAGRIPTVFPGPNGLGIEDFVVAKLLVNRSFILNAKRVAVLHYLLAGKGFRTKTSSL